MKNKLLSVIAAASLATTSFASLAVAASAADSGTIGTASYTIDNDGVLSVGSGSFNKTQWRDKFITTGSNGSPTGAKDVAKTITKVTFEQGATVTDSAAGMFYGWTALQEADLSNLNASNVTDMWAMFMNCRSLTTVNLSGLDTAKATYMDQMFYSCRALSSLDLSSFNTKNVTTTNGMFYDCRALETVTFGDDFDTSKVTNMNGMFYCCYKLKSLDLSQFSTANVKNMTQMFYYCEEMTTITVGNGWNTDNVTSSNNMFGACTKLVGGAGTAYKSTNKKDKTYAKIDGGESDPGYLTSKAAHTHSFTYQGNNNTITATCNNTGCTITGGMTLTINAPGNLFYDGNAKEATLTGGYNSDAFPNPEIVYYQSGNETAISGAPSAVGSYIAKVTMDGAIAQISFEIVADSINYSLKENDPTTIEATGSSFSGTKVLTINAPSNLIYNGMMKEATLNDYDHNAFPGEYTVTYYKSGDEQTALSGAPVELGSYIAKVTVGGVTAQVVFSIEGKVGTAPYTLSDGTLTIGSGSFTRNQFQGQFSTSSRRASIKNITFENGATLTDTAENLFKSWSALETADLTNLTADSITGAAFMFYDCAALTNVTFGVGFNTAEVTNMNCMFYNCDSLTSLDISAFNTAKVTQMSTMFSSCDKLTTILVGGGWNTDAVTNSAYMFSGDTKLKGSLGTTYSIKAADMDKSRAHIDEGLSNPGYLTDKNHTHSFGYSLSEDHTTITASCNGTGTCSLNGAGEHSVSIKITVPKTLNVFGKDNDPETLNILNRDLYRAPIEGVAAFNAATGNVVRDTWKDNTTTNDMRLYVQYYRLENGTEVLLGTEPPCKEAGDYRAKLTIENVTAYVDYSLQENTVPATATYEQEGEDYQPQFDGDTAASLWRVTVKAGSDSIETIDVKLGDIASEEKAQTLETPITTDAEIVLGVVTNLSGEAVNGMGGFTVMVNGEAL